MDAVKTSLVDRHVVLVLQTRSGGKEGIAENANHFMNYIHKHFLSPLFPPPPSALSLLRAFLANLLGWYHSSPPLSPSYFALLTDRGLALEPAVSSAGYTSQSSLVNLSVQSTMGDYHL